MKTVGQILLCLGVVGFLIAAAINAVTATGQENTDPLAFGPMGMWIAAFAGTAGMAFLGALLWLLAPKKR